MEQFSIHYRQVHIYFKYTHDCYYTVSRHKNPNIINHTDLRHQVSTTLFLFSHDLCEIMHPMWVQT